MDKILRGQVCLIEAILGAMPPCPLIFASRGLVPQIWEFGGGGITAKNARYLGLKGKNFLLPPKNLFSGLLLKNAIEGKTFSKKG